jgi:vacuolar-type H+-ATPase subunit I/STV1
LPTTLWLNSVNWAMSSLKTYVFPTYPLSLSPSPPTPQLNPDVNPFQRSFVGEIRRIEEMARRVRFFAAQIERERDPVPIRPLYDSAPLIAVGPRAAQTIDDLDVTLNEHESRLQEMNSAYELLSERLAELIEARHVLRETAVFFHRVRASSGHCVSSAIATLSPR